MHASLRHAPLRPFHDQLRDGAAGMHEAGVPSRIGTIRREVALTPRAWLRYRATPDSRSSSAHRGDEVVGWHFLMEGFRSLFSESSRWRRSVLVVSTLLMAAAGTLQPEQAAAGQSFTALSAMDSPASLSACHGQSNG